MTTILYCWTKNSFASVHYPVLLGAKIHFIEEIGRAHAELQSHSDLVCRLLLEKKKIKT